ncbi:MAG: metalloregulator ArsR/SmtB family transcription factor [Actinomycetota bacterium]|nr:metalloregulator ArsR/SmtB family transcription factor [Actinomycetota bacterium]
MTVDTSTVCCSPRLAGHVDQPRAVAVSELAKLLSDPIRVQVLDVLRGHEEAVCQCELAPLFDVSQPTLSHHLRKLEEAGVVAVERRGRWAYYSMKPQAMEVLGSWLS